MNRGTKTALKHAANAIAGIRGTQVELGASRSNLASLFSTEDRFGRMYPSVYLARRAGYRPNCQQNAQTALMVAYELTLAQAQKLDKVASSTHNIKQRGERVANFLRRVAENPSYCGRTGTTTTGAVAATI